MNKHSISSTAENVANHYHVQKLCHSLSLCALMEVLRWKGKHEIFCHSPSLWCSSATSITLSGRGGKKTACETILFFNLQYNEPSELSLIIMLEHSILMQYGYICLKISNSKARTYKKTQFYSHVQKLSVQTLSPPPISSHQLPCYKILAFTSSLSSPTRRPWI